MKSGERVNMGLAKAVQKNGDVLRMEGGVHEERFEIEEAHWGLFAKER